MGGIRVAHFLDTCHDGAVFMELQGVDLVGGVAEVDSEKFLRTIHPTGVFEVRSMNCPDRAGGTYLSTARGFFNDHAIAAREAKKLDSLKSPGVFCTVNSLLPALLGRANNRIVHKVKTGESAADEDVLRRVNLFIDIDAVKDVDISGISSTHREMSDALEKAVLFREKTRSIGWPEPIIGMSGNGALLLYKIDMDVTQESKDAIGRVYAKLGGACGISVDSKVLNAARLTKVLGTVARKGDELIGVEGLEDRPHRRTWYVLPSKYELLTNEQFMDVAGKTDSVSVSMSYSGDSSSGAVSLSSDLVQDDSVFSESSIPLENTFDIDEWIRKHNVPVRASVPWSDGRKYVFTELPVLCQNSPSGHTDIAACIYVHGSGAVSASCSHERCKWEWKDLREYYEPEVTRKKKRQDELYAAEKETIDDANESLQESDLTFGELAAGFTKAQDKIALAKAIRWIKNWKVECVSGDPLAYRIYADMFNLAGDYLELAGSDLFSYGKFDAVLADRCRAYLPPEFVKVWSVAAKSLIARSVLVDGGSERDMRRLVAGSVYKLITAYDAKEFDTYIESPGIGNADYRGVLFMDTKGVRTYLLEYEQVCIELRNTLADFKPMSLTRAFESCGVKSKPVHRKSWNRRYWHVYPDGLARLAEYAGFGTSSQIIKSIEQIEENKRLYDAGDVVPFSGAMTKSFENTTNDYYESDASGATPF